MKLELRERAGLGVRLISDWIEWCSVGGTKDEFDGAFAVRIELALDSPTADVELVSLGDIVGFAIENALPEMSNVLACPNVLFATPSGGLENVPFACLILDGRISWSFAVTGLTLILDAAAGPRYAPLALETRMLLEEFAVTSTWVDILVNLPG